MHNDLVKSTGKRSNADMNARCHQGKMDFGHGKNRMDVEEDRLSSLPDELIHKILSFISIRQAIGTSVLSSRWRIIWTSIPYLNFSSEDFSSNFVSNVLSRRNNQIQVSSVKLRPVTHESVKSILNYTFSQNVQQLTVTCEPHIYTVFPLPLFSSQSLKHLTLSGAICASFSTSTWDLPALTTLHLDHVTLYDECTDLFSKCTNLRNLSLRRCTTIGTNVFAPQLKNLTIECCYGKLLISSPGLTSLVMKGFRRLQLSTEGLCSLEKVDFCIYDTRLEDAFKICYLLQELRSVKFVTLNLAILELLSSAIGSVLSPPFVFAHVKILKFTTNSPVMVYLEVQAQEQVTISTEIENYKSSPSAICTLVSCEEIRVMKSIISAQRLMEDLRMMLNICKNSDTHHKVHMESRERNMHEHDKTQVKKHWAVQSSFELQGQFGEMMAQMKQGKIEGLLTILPTKETCDVIASSQCIEGLVTKLPASKRDVMQEIFSSMCEDAVILINKLLGSYKDLVDERNEASGR